MSILLRTALVDLGLETEDPGLAPHGARCGEARLCDHHQCVPLEQLLVTCPEDCSGHGACDNNRTCHCDPGWTGDTCNVSRDSVTILVTVMASITLLMTCWQAFSTAGWPAVCAGFQTLRATSFGDPQPYKTVASGLYAGGLAAITVLRDEHAAAVGWVVGGASLT